MTTIILKPKKDEAILRFHPWVFSGAIQKIVLDKDYPFAEPQEGEFVKIADFNGKTLGVGHYQIGSIAVRVLAFGTDSLPADFFEQRLRAAYLVRKQLNLIREDNNTYRLVHGEGDFLPGLVIDIYADTAVVQAHSVGMHRHRQQIAKAIVHVVPEVKNVYYKSDDTLPFKAPIEGDKTGYLINSKLLPIGTTTLNSKLSTLNSIEDFWATENGLDFRIDWLRGQKTGFFIDQRENRSLLERYAQGKDVLNMFCYTGGFSVYALRGGAKSVDSVDVSEKAIELVNKNVERNFPLLTTHHAYAQEAFEYLAGCKDKYDLIILDPPAFAKHRDAIKNALRGYQRLNAKGIEQLRPGGILFTFSCSQAIDKEMFRLAVFSAAAQVGRKVRILHQLHQPQDHPINIFHPEGEYLKGLVLQVE
ncbi:MAG: class I SAM-dependent rRNA methyltransferase [Paludibacteraceae bacterium]|nr:class I SAM-dependent rRNA methyltransferase [Paludibacteraceae bacterium]